MAKGNYGYERSVSMRLLGILCFFRGVFWTLRFGGGTWIDGHDYVEIQDPESTRRGTMLMCETCGRISK